MSAGPDPLGGAKDFVKRSGEFAVNIALVQDSRPVAGVVRASEGDLTYCGAADRGACKIRGDGAPAAISGAGSSVKILMVAEGSAGIYPRSGPTMGWDAAPAHAVAAPAGRHARIWKTGRELFYNKETLENDWFLAG